MLLQLMELKNPPARVVFWQPVEVPAAREVQDSQRANGTVAAHGVQKFPACVVF